MSEMHCIRIEVDDHCYGGLMAEAHQLGLGVEEMARRAVAAWLIEVAENATTSDERVAVAAGERPAVAVVEEPVATAAVG